MHFGVTERARFVPVMSLFDLRCLAAVPMPGSDSAESHGAARAMRIGLSHSSGSFSYRWDELRDAYVNCATVLQFLQQP